MCDVARVDQMVRLIDDDEVLACLLGPEHALVIGLQLIRSVGDHPVPQHVHEREHLRLEHLVAEACEVSERERDDELLVEPVDGGVAVEDVAIVMNEVRDGELDVLETSDPVRADCFFDRRARVVRVKLTTNKHQEVGERRVPVRRMRRDRQFALFVPEPVPDVQIPKQDLELVRLFLRCRRVDVVIEHGHLREMLHERECLVGAPVIVRHGLIDMERVDEPGRPVERDLFPAELKHEIGEFARDVEDADLVALDRLVEHGLLEKCRFARAHFADHERVIELALFVLMEQVEDDATVRVGHPVIRPGRVLERREVERIAASDGEGRDLFPTSPVRQSLLLVIAREQALPLPFLFVQEDRRAEVPGLELLHHFLHLHLERVERLRLHIEAKVQIFHRLALGDLFVELVQFLIRLPGVDAVDVVLCVLEACVLFGHRLVDGLDDLALVGRPDVERRQNARHVQNRFEPVVVDERLIFIDVEARQIAVAEPDEVGLKPDAALRLDLGDDVGIVAFFNLDGLWVLLFG